VSIDNVLDVIPRDQYTALAAQTDFFYTFPIFEDGDLVVDVDGVTKSLGTDYTVSGASDDTGGTVTFLVAMTGGEIVTIYRDIPIERTSDFQTNGPLRSVTFNDELDRITMIEQQLEAKIGRAIRFPITAVATDAQNELSPISSWVGKFLRVSAAGILEAAELVSNVVALTQSVIAGIWQPRSLAELAAGAVPVNLAKPEGHVERYANWVNSSTDFTAAFQAAAAVANQRPGLVIQFEPGRTYAVWPSNGGSALFQLTNAKGVTIEGNGALIQSAAITTGLHDVINLNNCSRISVRNFAFQQGDGTVRDPLFGAQFVIIRRGSFNIHFENVAMYGGRSMIDAIGTVGPHTEAPRSYNITVNGLYAHTVYYAQLFQASGDNYFARGVTTINCGRSYFPYNCHTHDVVMYSEQGGPFADVLLKCYGIAGGYSRLQNIKLRYTSLGKFAGSGDQTTGDQLLEIEAQPDGGTTPSAFEDIDVTFDVECSSTDQWAGIFGIRKFDGSSNRDTSDRGHTFGNIKIGGFVRSAENLLNTKIVDLFTTDGGTAWDGSLDSAWNISVEKLFIAGTTGKTAVAVADGRLIKSNLVLRNIQTTEALSVVGVPQSTPVDYTNIISSNFKTSASDVPVWTGGGGNPAIGDGTIVGDWIISGGRVTRNLQVTIGASTTFGSGVYNFNVPIACSSGTGGRAVGSLGLLDSGTGFRSGVSRIAPGATVIEGFIDSDTTTFRQGNPITLAAGDQIMIGISYRHSPNI